MTVYQWADGYHPPKGVTAEAIGEVLEALPEPTPEALFEASKSEAHVLHGHLWSEGDQVWATRARLEECRHVINGVRAVYTVGPKIITVRAIEFLREDGEGSWKHIDDILANKDLHRAYMAEIKRLQEQALNKMDAFMTLLERD